MRDDLIGFDFDGEAGALDSAAERLGELRRRAARLLPAVDGREPLPRDGAPTPAVRARQREAIDATLAASRKTSDLTAISLRLKELTAEHAAAQRLHGSSKKGVSPGEER